MVVGASATGVQIAARDPALGPARHAGRRRARPRAADVPGPRHPLVDGGGGRARRALRRGRRHRAGAPRAVDAARRLAGARDVRPQRARRSIGVQLVGRLAGINGRPGAVLRVAAQQVRAGRPQARPARSTPSTSGRRRPASTTRCRRRTGSRRPRCRARRRSASIWPAARSRPSSGRPASAPTTPGSTSTCSTPRGWSGTTAASCRLARHVPDRHAVPASAQVELHRRGRRRRRGPRGRAVRGTWPASGHDGRVRRRAAVDARRRRLGPQGRRLRDARRAVQLPRVRRVHHRLAVDDGDMLLDVACGSGLALELARLRGAAVAGIDASERLVAVARDRNPGR